MAKAKTIVNKETNYKDLSDEKRAEILSQDFIKFQEEELAKIGMQIGVRLNATATKIEAVMVPIKVPTEAERKQYQDNVQE